MEGDAYIPEEPINFESPIKEGYEKGIPGVKSIKRKLNLLTFAFIGFILLIIITAIVIFV